jgi:hypothetical protein
MFKLFIIYIFFYCIIYIMYGVLIDDDYNRRIGEIVQSNGFRKSYEPQPFRYIGGGVVEENNYRPRGGVYVTKPHLDPYIVPYSIVGYPQYNAVELIHADKLGATTHVGGSQMRKQLAKEHSSILDIVYPELEGDGLKEMGRTLKKGLKSKTAKKIYKTAKDVATSSTAKKIYKTAIDVAKPAVKTALSEYMNPLLANVITDSLASEANNKIGDGVKRGRGRPRKVVQLEGDGLKEIGRKLKKDLTSSTAKKAYKIGIDVATPIVATSLSPYMNPILATALTTGLAHEAKKKIGNGAKRGRPRKIAGVGVYEGGAVSAGATKKAKSGDDKRKKRGALIKKIMSEKGMKLGEASKYIKENNLL